MDKARAKLFESLKRTVLTLDFDVCARLSDSTVYNTIVHASRIDLMFFIDMLVSQSSSINLSC